MGPTSPSSVGWPAPAALSRWRRPAAITCSWWADREPGRRCWPAASPRSSRHSTSKRRWRSRRSIPPPGRRSAGRLVRERPFRAPHHTASAAALVGGGSGRPRLGEVSLAHRGILFMDELAEFAPTVLDALRQPLEDRVVRISRQGASVTFPADFLLIACFEPLPLRPRAARLPVLRSQPGAVPAAALGPAGRPVRPSGGAGPGGAGRTARRLFGRGRRPGGRRYGPPAQSLSRPALAPKRPGPCRRTGPCDPTGRRRRPSAARRGGAPQLERPRYGRRPPGGSHVGRSRRLCRHRARSTSSLRPGCARKSCDRRDRRRRFPGCGE